MIYKSSGSTVILCILVVFLAILVSYLHHNPDVPDEHPVSVHDRTGRSGARLVVGVLSARDHQQQRDAIRDTWWPQLRAAGARGVFVLGDSDCPLADHCRVDRYSCEVWLPQHNADSSQRSLRLKPDRAVERPAAVGLTFTVLRSVVARAVTVTSHHFPGDVILESADGQPAATAAAAAAAEVTSPHDSSDVTAPLSPLLVLPAGFMGRLRLREPGLVSTCLESQAPALAELRITALITADGRHVKPGLEPLCCPLSLVYTIHEESGATKGASEVPGGTAGGRSGGDGTPEDDPPADCRRTDTEVVSRAVTEEAAQHGDLLLVPGPDVYRRLPDKLLSLFNWVATETAADWLVKCDDDVLLDVPRILQHVPPDTGEGVWWGQFRYNWPPDRYGKWAELVYQADVYPPFACGTASLLSADVVRWLADNREALTRFQGEDVSLGVWLAGHRVRRVPDPVWSCGDGDVGGYSRGQLTPETLRRTWRCLRRTGRLELCGAEQGDASD